MNEVFYEFRQSRSSKFLHEFLAEFNGVVVSDFYTGYDSLPQAQQKCLIHLIRDMNTDLQLAPFDNEFRSFVEEFGVRFGAVTETINEHGLNQRYLQKHKNDMMAFFEQVVEASLHSTVAQKYQARIKKYGNRMLTFMEYQGVCWNNAAAENAIKPFARVRRFADGRFTDSSVKELLSIMSVSVSIERMGGDFLRFLLSLVPVHKH